MDSNTSIQSTVGGENILIKSGGNTQLTGVKAKATETIRIETGGHLIMDAAKDTLSTKTSSSENSKWLGATVDKGDYTHAHEQVDAITTTLQAKNIATQSTGSTLLEGTQFHYSDNATVVSGGKLYLQAAISGTSEHTTSNDNYVVWQKAEDSGSIKQTATLPSFVGNNKPTIIALDGVEIQIPISQQEQKAGITLQEQIDTLIQQPEYSYLNQFIDKQDATWQEIILAEDSWDYEQEGLTPAGAALVAIAVGVATGGTASGIANTVAANVGSQTVGAMASAAFSSLTTQATIGLINNKGDVEATLKELGSKDSVKQLAFAMASAGISHKIDKGLGLKGVDITQTGFDQRLVKAIADSTSTSLLQTAVYGSDFEENLKKNLRMQFATVATQETFSNIVKDLDSDTLSDNIAHKIAAGLTGCLSAKAAGNDCDAATIGAVVGEMWGDWHTDNPNTLTQDEKEKLINQAKLIAGITAAYAGEDVNVAADMAAEAVRWNSTAQIFYYNELEEIKNDTDGTYAKEQLQAITNISDDLAELLENVVYLKNTRGDFIVCFRHSGESCQPRSGQRYATQQEIRQGYIDVAIEIIPDRRLKTSVKVVTKRGDRTVSEAVIEKPTNNQSKPSHRAAVYIPRDQELRELFTKTNPREGVRIGNRTLLPEPNGQGLVRIFRGASDAEVKQYFTELTGRPLPQPREITIGGNKGLLYAVKTENGSYNLRSVASSQSLTGLVWTIDIPKSVTGTTKNPEIKFLR